MHPALAARRLSSALSSWMVLRVTLVLAAVSISAAGCGSLFGPNHQLAGEWATAPIPSGGSISMALSTSGNRVSGNGQSRDIGPNGAISLFTVEGSRSGDTFALTLSFDSGKVVSYSGSFVDANTLAGPWALAGQSSGFVRLYRQSML
jgi:hypothetical protein